MEVKSRIVKVDLEKRRLNLSLKTEVLEALPETDDNGEKLREDSPVNSQQNGIDIEDDSLFYGDVEAFHNQVASNPEGSTPPPMISIDKVFDWDENDPSQSISIANSKDSSMGDEEEEMNVEDQAFLNRTQKKSKKAKHIEEDEEEKAIAEREEELMNRKLPRNIDDYERLLLASPNSSYLWIKYMAFQLSMMEVDKSRAIAERALKTIQFRDEQEKQNVWLALLNLENIYGTQETLNKTLERAVNHNNPKYIYMQMIKIYEKSEKFDSAESLFQLMCKKFKESSKVWIEYGMFKLRQNQTDAARKLMQRSLLSLPRRKRRLILREPSLQNLDDKYMCSFIFQRFLDIKTICKFAQMEFKYAEAERGRTIFEGIMANYPKRADLWNIFLDMELRTGDPITIR